MDEFFRWFAADTAVDAGKNYILFDNFVVQGYQKELLTYNPECQDEDKKKVNESEGPTSAKNAMFLDAYLSLYDALNQIKVIETDAGFFYIFSAGYSQKVTQDLAKLKIKYIQEELQKVSDDKTKKLLSCFKIDYTKLLTFLQNYKYDVTDQAIYLKMVGDKKSGGKSMRKSMRKRFHRYRRTRQMKNKKV